MYSRVVCRRRFTGLYGELTRNLDNLAGEDAEGE